MMLMICILHIIIIYEVYDNFSHQCFRCQTKVPTMPGKVKVRVLAGRNLPVMDRSSDTTDAYVEVKLGQVTFKTEVFRKSLNPQWNSEWFRFEVTKKRK